MNAPNWPLYQEFREAFPTLGDGHRGLWYDRFFHQYDDQWQVYKENEKKGIKEGKREWISTVEGHVGDAAALQAASGRLASLCKSLHGEFNVYAAPWHFATGLGYPHPVENGFLWHPTLGTPYIPGSAVKGLVRAWVEAWMDVKNDETARTSILHRWFGSEDKDPEVRKLDTEAGPFIFFDALPVAPVELKADVMTPHMGGWYEKGGDDPMNPDVIPADWHNPVPVPFLVADKPKFLFAVAPRDGKQNTELAKVMTALNNALEWLGAGAKTAVGYGHLSSDEKEREAICKRIERAAMSAEELMVSEVKELTPDQIAKKLGKDRNKTKTEKGDSWNVYLKQVNYFHGDQIRSWEHSINPNEKKAYKTVFANTAGD